MRLTPRGRFLHVLTRVLIATYKLTGGAVGGRMRGLPGILVTTTGRKSGEPRTVHLPYVPDGDAMLLVASYAGGDRNPAWFHNIVANPTVTIRDHKAVFTASAAPVDDAAYQQVWAGVVARAPWYADYQTRTERRIPVVRVTRSSPS